MHLDIKLLANEETLRREETSGDVRHTSLCTRPMMEQTWVLVQAKSHLPAQTLRGKLSAAQL